MRSPGTMTPRDLYVGCFTDVDGWGGALAFARRVIAASEPRRSTLLLGTTTAPDAPAAVPDDAREFNVPVPVEPLLWRVRHWRVGAQLLRQLRRLPAPRVAFLALSPHWVIAAKRAWPDVPVIYKLPCLLHNCLPFTWLLHRPPTFWRRVDFAGITHAEHLAFALANLVLTPTESTRDEVLTFHPSARARVAVLPYGPGPQPVDPARRAAQRRTLGLNDNVLAFLAAGVCDLNKAFDLAIRALPSVHGRGHLVIAGDGPERMRLARLADALGVAGRVHLVGAQRDMAPWYAAADCVLSTSHYDTFPNVLQEGLSCGRPALVPRHAPPEVYAGFAEIVAAEGGGVLFDRSRPGALAAAMNRLIDDSSARLAWGREAAEICERRARTRVDIDSIWPDLQEASPGDGMARRSSADSAADRRPECVVGSART